MTQEKVTLYYVHDPMCAWCWGYKPVWAQIEAALSERVEIVYLVGGLRQIQMSQCQKLCSSRSLLIGKKFMTT